jgi:LmbE family N-acetylglucosaminyl deacetylase
MATILALHAHPDDTEMLGAGALALLAAKGHAIRIATATAGELGSTEHAPAATGRIRKHEAGAAAALIGATYACADLPDLGVFNDDDARRRITDLLRQARPDIVITASPVDYHPDHEAVSLLARDACFASTVPHYAVVKPLDVIPHLYFMDPIGGRDRERARVRPDFGIDVGAVMELKRRMLLCHESQHAWVAKQHGVNDYLAAMERWAERRGRDFGVGHAEGFRQYRNQPYPRSPLLQELLAEALVDLKDWPG